MPLNRGIDQKRHDTLGFLGLFDKRLRAEFRHERIRVMPGRQHQNTGIDEFPRKNLDAAVCGLDAGVIRIKNQNRTACLADISPQHTDMMICQGCPQRADRISDAVLIQRDNIEITFNNINQFCGSAMCLGNIQAVQRMALTVNFGFR